MLGVVLIVITLLAISGALFCGLITWSIGRSTTVSPKRSFAWGVVLGPFGVVPVLRERQAFERQTRPTGIEQGW